MVQSSAVPFATTQVEDRTALLELVDLRVRKAFVLATAHMAMRIFLYFLLASVEGLESNKFKENHPSLLLGKNASVIILAIWNLER